MNHIPLSTAILLTLLVFMIGTISYLGFLYVSDRIEKQSEDKIFQDCDVNGDGLCDIFDLQKIQRLMGSCQGDPLFRKGLDFDKDGCLTIEGDFSDILTNYFSHIDLSKVPTPMITRYDDSCDYDKDFDCDADDLLRHDEIVTEENNITALVRQIESFQIDNQYYPKSVNELIPHYMEAIPEISDLEYRQQKGGRAYELCYVSISSERSKQVCFQQTDD